MRFHFSYIFIGVFCLILQLKNFVKADDVSSLVSEIKIFRTDSVFKVNYLYDKNHHPVLMSKYLMQPDEIALPFSQTELFKTNNLTSQIVTRNWVNQHWVDTHISEMRYENDNLIHLSRFNITGGNKVPGYTKSVEYINGQQKRLSINHYQSGYIRNTQHVDISYDQNRVLQHEIEYDNLVDDKQKHRYTYKYDGELLIESVLQSLHSDGLWRNKSKTSYNYLNFNGVSKLVRQKTSMWDSMNSKWINYAIVLYDFNTEGDLVSETFAHWKTMSWVETLKYEYLYNDNQQLLKRNLLKPIYQKWRIVSTIDYQMPSSLQMNVESRFGFWGGNAGDFNSENIPFNVNGVNQIVKAEKLEISLMANNTIDISDNQGFVVYPNPSDGIFYINTKIKPSDQWKVYDLQGKLIHYHSGNSFTGVIDLRNQPPGVYILESTNNQQTNKQKLIIQK